MNGKFLEAYNAFIKEVSQDEAVLGLLFFGSIQQGQGKHSSDLDFYAIVEGNEGWNYKKFVKDVLVEAYFFPRKQWEVAIEESPHVMIAFATGTNVIDVDGHLEQLINKAKKYYRDGPEELTPRQKTNWRITLTELLSDLDGIEERNKHSGIFLGSAIMKALEGYCALNRIWTVKQEDLASYLSGQDAELAGYLNVYEQNSSVENAKIILSYILNRHGGRVG